MNAIKDVAEITQGNIETVSSYAERLKSRMSLMWQTMAIDGDVGYPELTNVIKAKDPHLTDAESREKAREQIQAFQLINRANQK